MCYRAALSPSTSALVSPLFMKPRVEHVLSQHGQVLATTPGGLYEVPHIAGYTCDPQLSRTSNSPLWAFITAKDLLAASGQILVAANSR